MSGIIKVYKIDSGFELVPRETIQDPRLSLQALGLLINICSYPEDWKLYKTELYQRFAKNKRSSVQSAWKELMDAGYILEKRERDGKKWNYIYAVRLIPFTDKEKEEFLGCCFSTAQNEQPKMSSPKSTHNKIHNKQNTQKQNTNEHITHHHPLIEGFNQHQSDLIHEFLKAKKIDDDLKNKLLEKLKGKRFKYMAYIEKTFETVKNMVDPNDKKPIRKEIVPDWLDQEYQPPEYTEEEWAEIERKRAELAERLKKYEDLNEKRAW
jgi:hypothetical protein